MDTVFLLTDLLPEFFSDMRNKWSEQNQQVADKFLSQLVFDDGMCLAEAVHFIGQFHNSGDCRIESKFAVKVFRNLGNRLMKLSSECKFIFRKITF